MPENFTLRIQKQAFKFASSHMTVFPDGTKESLHGHSFVPTVVIHVKSADFKSMIPFSKVKVAMKAIAEAWDEKLLLAQKNQFFKIKKLDKNSIHFTLCKKEYLIPQDEVVLLPVTNITCEELAKAYSQELLKLAPFLKKSPVLQWSVEIEESPGQGATYSQKARP